MPRFVIQQHDARAMHWDFRLEAGGVLKSWAVPKGPSFDPSKMQMAIHVEDHPLDYAGFEGTIPPRQYGAGTVIVWDRGSYRPLGDKPVEQAIEDGHLSFWLEGEKLRGGWTLQRAEGSRWLLVKRRDEEADARRRPTSTHPESVVSGRTIDQVR